MGPLRQAEVLGLGLHPREVSMSQHLGLGLVQDQDQGREEALLPLRVISGAQVKDWVIVEIYLVSWHAL